MITPADLSPIPLFAALPPALLARVAQHAADVRVQTGDWIVHEGEPPRFWALLEGEVEAIKTVGGVQGQATTFDPGEFFGEVPIMLGVAVAFGLRALKPSRLASIDPNDFHSILTESREAGAILSETLARRVNFIRDAYASATLTQATIVGDPFDFACHDLRDFLSRNQIGYEWLDPSDPGDISCIPADVLAAAKFPVVVLADGRVLRTPDLRQLAEGLNLDTRPSGGEYDVAIIGGGPAGLAAAVYGGSEGLRTTMIEREAPGGQAGTSSRIENYLGFPGGISGSDLSKRAFQQAKRFNTEIVVTREVESIESTAEGHVVRLDGGDEVKTKTIVLATGVTWRRLKAEGVEKLVGRGVYYGAARTEAQAVRDKQIFLVGGGNSAGQAAMFFSNYARSVTILIRGTSLAKSMSHYLIEQLASKANVFVETETTVAAVDGDAHLDSITTRSENTGAVTQRPADALFTFIGADADTAWLGPEIQRDGRGYVLTGRDIVGWKETRQPFSLETSVPGIFAAGDVRSTSIKRVASGVGEGSVVIAFIHEYLEALGARTALAAT